MREYPWCHGQMNEPRRIRLRVGCAEDAGPPDFLLRNSVDEGRDVLLLFVDNHLSLPARWPVSEVSAARCCGRMPQR